MNELLEDAFNIFITTFYPERSNNIVLTENTTNIIEEDTNITNENNNIKEQKIKGQNIKEQKINE